MQTWAKIKESVYNLEGMSIYNLEYYLHEIGENSWLFLLEDDCREILEIYVCDTAGVDEDEFNDALLDMEDVREKFENAIQWFKSEVIKQKDQFIVFSRDYDTDIEACVIWEQDDSGRWDDLGWINFYVYNNAMTVYSNTMPHPDDKALYKSIALSNFDNLDDIKVKLDEILVQYISQYN